MNLTVIQEEARKTLIYYGNKVRYSGALGKKDYPSLLKDQERLNYLYGVIANSYNPASVKVSKYGMIYNSYVLSGIAPAGWHVPTRTEWLALGTYLSSNIGGKLKSATLWDSPNTGATNSSGFNALPSGFIYDDFVSLLTCETFWSSTPGGEDGKYSYFLVNNNADLTEQVSPYWAGASIRMIKDDSTDPLTFTDSDGNIYPTVKIGTQVWMASNLITTTLADGTPIAKVAVATTWSGLSTGAYTSYSDDDTNAYTLILGNTYFIGDKEVSLSFILKAIEMIRHFQCRATDLSTIGVTPSPPSPPSPSYGDLIRTGHKAVTIGGASVTFSSPLPSADYTVTAWVIGTGESQYDLGTITPSAGGFTASDITINGTLHYQAIINI